MGDKEGSLCTVINDVKYWGTCREVCGRRDGHCTCSRYRGRKANVKALNCVRKAFATDPATGRRVPT